MRNVLVTGGSRGVGLGVARKLAGSGYRVVALARREADGLCAAMAAVAASRVGALHFESCDLADLEAIPQVVRGLKARFGPFYGLVNNAGIGTDGLLANMHVSQIEALVRLNTTAPIVLTKHIIRTMMTERAGRIVNVSSVIGSTGYSGLSVYAATKASMIGFTKSLAREVGRLGITVNAVAPGFMDTDLTEALGADQRDQVVRRSALRRLVEVEDVANAVAFLMGDGGRNITGTVLTVDAGNTA
ncbi:MAG: SDR family NAD(P)-dependent oxidoreductase [Caulobacterales bacterium]